MSNGAWASYGHNVNAVAAAFPGQQIRAADVCSLLGVNTRRACKYLREWCKAGQARRISWGLYVVTGRPVTTSRRVLECMAKLGRPVTVAELAEVSGINRRTLVNTLSRLEYYDEIDRVKIGTYTLPGCEVGE